MIITYKRYILIHANLSGHHDTINTETTVARKQFQNVHYTAVHLVRYANRQSLTLDQK